LLLLLRLVPALLIAGLLRLGLFSPGAELIHAKRSLERN
jgi:hypothetical protein